MKNIILKALLSLLLSVTTMSLSAQSAGDKLYESGVKYQQTMTVASQNKAIAMFQKAYAAYDSQQKKKLCSQQITSCRNIIKQLSKKTKTRPVRRKATVQHDYNYNTEVDSVEEAPKPVIVELTVGSSYLKFKGKGEFKKVQVTCNQPDWKVSGEPSWINCSKSKEGELVIEAEKNTEKEERSANITVSCGDKSVNIVVVQEKYKKYIVF